MAASNLKAKLSLDSELVELVTLEGKWDRQDGPSDEIIAAVNTEISGIIERVREDAQHYGDQQLIDVLEHLVLQYKQDKIHGGQESFHVAVEQILDYIDGHHTLGPQKHTVKELSRLINIRGVFAKEEPMYDRLKRSIKLLKIRLRSPPTAVPEDPLSQTRQIRDPFSGNMNLEEPDFSTGGPPRALGFVTPTVGTKGLTSTAGSQADTNSNGWMGTDDFWLWTIRVAFLNGPDDFSLDGDQLIFKYLWDRNLFLFMRGANGTLPKEAIEFSCSPDEIRKVSIEQEECYTMLYIQSYGHTILIHTIASVLRRWVCRLQTLNPNVVIERTS